MFPVALSPRISGTIPRDARRSLPHAAAKTGWLLGHAFGVNSRRWPAPTGLDPPHARCTEHLPNSVSDVLHHREGCLFRPACAGCSTCAKRSPGAGESVAQAATAAGNSAAGLAAATSSVHRIRRVQRRFRRTLRSGPVTAYQPVVAGRSKALCGCRGQVWSGSVPGRRVDGRTTARPPSRSAGGRARPIGGTVMTPASRSSQTSAPSCGQRANELSPPVTDAAAGRCERPSAQRGPPPGGLLGAVRTVAAGESLRVPAVTRRLIGRHAGHIRPSGTGEPRAGQALSGSNRREREVLSLIATGMSNEELAEAQFVSAETVKTYVSRLPAKLRLRDSATAHDGNDPARTWNPPSGCVQSHPLTQPVQAAPTGQLVPRGAGQRHRTRAAGHLDVDPPVPVADADHGRLPGCVLHRVGQSFLHHTVNAAAKPSIPRNRVVGMPPGLRYRNRSRAQVSRHCPDPSVSVPCESYTRMSPAGGPATAPAESTFFSSAATTAGRDRGRGTT